MTSQKYRLIKNALGEYVIQVQDTRTFSDVSRSPLVGEWVAAENPFKDIEAARERLKLLRDKEAAVQHAAEQQRLRNTVVEIIEE